MVLVSLIVLLVGLPVAAAEGGDGVTRVFFGSRAQLAELAARLDVWEVVYAAGRTDSGYVVAWVTEQDAARLATAGVRVEADRRLATAPETIPAYPCYRTIAELYAQLDVWAGQYPLLTELYAIGDSYEGRPLQVLRLTNEATGLDKPLFFLMANIHGRELITPEVAMAFIETLLTGYGRTPDLTWLLDHHRIEVLVSANPDGHVRNEAVQPWAYWRKNANPTYGWCDGTHFGIDLNRNSGFHWGGASQYPCDETYQGPFAVSEGETLAVQGFIGSLFPDQRPAGDTEPAPLDTTGIFITLHSYSNLVLWPWGYTDTLAPNAAELAALGRKLATYNGYTPQQAVALYPTTGSTDDWAYGELGIASYTFEIGSSLDGFYPPCSRYDALVEPNVRALLYAAKVSRAPYLLPYGPDALDVTADVEWAGEAQMMTVGAQIDDRYNGGRPISGAEAYVDIPPWEGGTPVPLVPSDGAYNSAVELVGGTFPLSSAISGRHTVYVRGRDVDGAWGPVTAAFAQPVHAIALAPAVLVAAARPGAQITHTLALTNTGLVSETVTLMQSDTRWPTMIALSSVTPSSVTPSSVTPSSVTLGPGAVQPIALTVTIPLTVAEHLVEGHVVALDTVTVTASLSGTTELVRTAVVHTHALWASVLLPVVVRDAVPITAVAGRSPGFWSGGGWGR